MVERSSRFYVDEGGEVMGEDGSKWYFRVGIPNTVIILLSVAAMPSLAGTDGSVAGGVAGAIMKKAGQQADKNGAESTKANTSKAGEKAERKAEKAGVGDKPQRSRQSPVRVTVEWNGRKVTVEIPDDNEQSGGRATATDAAAKGRRQGASGPPVSGKSEKEQPPWKKTLENALNKVIKDSLKGYDAKGTAASGLEKAMERVQSGLQQAIANMALVKGTAGGFEIRIPQMDESAPKLGPSDPLGELK